MILTKEQKIAGYWKALAISTQEKDLKTAFKCCFALKALFAQRAQPSDEDLEFIPIDPDGGEEIE